jgi:hypothetical protein
MRNVRYTEKERRELESLTAWHIEQEEPPPKKQGNWQHIWRFKFAIGNATGITDALPLLIHSVKERFPKRRKLTISAD